MADSQRNDPLPVFCFLVTIGDLKGEAFFKSVSGIKYEMETIPVKEGGNNSTTYQLIGAAKWSNLVLKQGYTAQSSASGLLAWREEWMSQRGGRRMDGTVTILDTALKKQTTWSWKRGFPVKWELSELDASKSELAIETIEIAHEGLMVVK